jgi:S-adenosylmethionine/arginine decarboxylase-like enzyme
MVNGNKLEPEYIAILEKVRKKFEEEVDNGKENIFDIVPFVPALVKGGNPVAKTIDAYLWGVPDEVFDPKNLFNTLIEMVTSSNAHIKSYMIDIFKPQGFSGSLHLYESIASLHTFPERNYFSILLQTCGSSAHPINSIKNLLNKSKANWGNFTYSKEGYDTINKDFVMERNIENLIKKYDGQFSMEKYVFAAEETDDFRYDFSFFDPLTMGNVRGMPGKLKKKWAMLKDREKGIYLMKKIEKDKEDNYDILKKLK